MTCFFHFNDEINFRSDEDGKFDITDGNGVEDGVSFQGNDYEQQAPDYEQVIFVIVTATYHLTFYILQGKGEQISIQMKRVDMVHIMCQGTRE